MCPFNLLETYEYLHRVAPDFHQQIVKAANQAHNEAEFEHTADNEIAKLAKQLGIDLLFREQYTLATGRADAVYNRFIIEYEPPGSLRSNLSNRHTAHAVQQVKDYIVGLAGEEHHDRNRLLGVAFDGRYFIFVRYHEGHWVVEEPLEVNPASCERFLRSLFSLSSGRALIPPNLVEDFGNQNLISQQATRALYNALEGHTDDLTARLFEQWKLFFGETAGADAATGELKHKKELRAFAHGMGLRDASVDMPCFLFALHTYFSFLVKNIARLVLQAYAGGGLGTTPLTTIANLEGKALRRELHNLESGGIFRTLGINNLLEGDFFSWYLDAWDDGIEAALHQVLARLAEYNPVTVQDDPHSARDLLKKLYHYLLPRDIRHDLGEFYTPDWLAARLLNQLSEPLFRMPRPGVRIPPPTKRLLDPACGSGTFLILAARALKANCFQAGLAEADTLEIILNSVVGIDLNPLAVMAARVNYLLAVADLLPYRRGEVEIPVYLADSILTPTRGEGMFAQNRRILETAVGPLPVPEAIDSRPKIEHLSALLEEYVTGDFEPEVFLAHCKREIPDLDGAADADVVLTELYEKLCTLHWQGLDGIWARVLKNAFMPLFLEPFDYVIGNPPWINWESLPQGYRTQVAPLWQEYALFQHKGFDAILGKAKDDISALMTYVAADRYLKDGGKLAFVITQSVWKTAGGGQGFRRFRIGEDGPFLQVLHVDDLSRSQVFEGASTRTSVFVLQKGRPTRYPVPYTYWKKTTRGKGLDYDSTLDEVLAQTKRLQFYATPVDKGDPTSPWLTARRKALDAVRKVLGRSDYRAYEGANSGGANAVYWLDILAERPDGLLVVRNVTEGAKRKVEAITTELESDLVHPLLRGRDVKRWYAAPTYRILLTHREGDRLNAIPEKEMQQRYPKTWAYLKRFEKPLRERKSQVVRRLMETGTFYSIFGVGDYTFASWKVVWGRIGNRIESAVVSNMAGKSIIPQETISLVACDNREEAHYIAATINSTPFQFAAYSYSQAGGKSFGSPHVLENIRIPRFNPNDAAHSTLSRLSHRAHELAPRAYNGDEAAQVELKQVEADIDRAAARLWGLTDEELREIQASLEELKG